MKSNNDSIIQQFKEVGTETIPASSVSDVESSMRAIFTAYPSKYFDQPSFVALLKKSNPRVNKILRKLVDEKFIERTAKVSNKYLYKKV